MAALSPNDKKRFQAFLGDVLQVGCLKGFKYFALYLRGREELICRVLNEPMSPEIWSYYTSPNSEKMKTGASSFSFDNVTLPRHDASGIIAAVNELGALFTERILTQVKYLLATNRQSLIMSVNTQRSLSGFGFMDVGLPPASPSEKDIDLKDDKSTLFLIAAYARYSCPYVWVRSNHERLVVFSSSDEKLKQRDSPLRLKSTSEWKQRDTKLWDIIAEAVKLCMSPAPLNPFAVDFKYFEGLQLVERVIATGAMANFLQKVVTSGDHAYNARVFDDLGEITRRHFKDLQVLVRQRRQEETQEQAQYGYEQQQYYQTGPVQQPAYSSQYRSHANAYY